MEQAYSLIIILGIVIAIALIAIAFCVLVVKRRVAAYSVEFSRAVDEFNDLCDPGKPEIDHAWEQFASAHLLDFEHAAEVLSTKLVVFAVKDLSSAQRLVDIQEYHDVYLSEVKIKRSNINIVGLQLESVIQARSLLFDGKHYVANSDAIAFLETYKDVIDAVRYCVDNDLCQYIAQSRQMLDFYHFISQIEVSRESHNNQFMAAELRRCSAFFDDILSYPLDAQQRKAIVNGEDNCLVVSSAGSGKTSTIQGKVRYLIDMCAVDPNDILIITYTRKAAEELRKRIGYCGLVSSTFHGLAYNIISQVDKAPSIASADFSLNLFYELLKQHDFVKAISHYLVHLMSCVKDLEKYTSEREYLADRRKYGIQSYFPDMDGKIIFTKSEQERKICHFLSIHSIRFRYEERYEFDTATTSYRQYKPDFTIYYTANGVTRKLYLEHYALGQNGMVPKWFGAPMGLTWREADIKYKESISWKRQTHRRNGTQLIETTSAMFSDDTWQQQLSSMLSAHGVALVEKSAEQVFQEIVSRDRHKEHVVLELIMSFVNLLKANCKNIVDIMSIARKADDSRDLYIMEHLIKPFFDAYQSALAQKGEIDFTDAILQATDYCNNGICQVKYKYIIVDEFQDISFDRYRFLMSLRNKSPLGKIFAVGDDWQSIYRFSGSDMGLFTDFPKHFGFTAMCKIESTYRFSQPAIGISSAFIQKNASQVKKDVKPSNHDRTTTVKFRGYSEDDDLVRSVADEIQAVPADKSVYILARYAFDFVMFRKAGYCYSELDRTISVTIGNRRVRCLTVHQTKGLEADYVVLLKCDNDTYGFPSMVSDDPVLEYLLTRQDESVDFAEERRVFYVAITRAKINTTIYYRKSRPSVFVDEIIDQTEQDTGKRCPSCGYGNVKILKHGWAKSKKYFVSLGCTNATCGCSFFRTVFYNQQPTSQMIRSLVSNDPHRRIM